MTSRRQRQWINERNSVSLSDGGQDSATIATTGFDKGETVVRTLLSVSCRVTTQNVPVSVVIAVWVGQFGGIPTNISADSPESYMLWDGWEQEEGTPGGIIHMYRTYDLRGQRASRSDSENIHFVAKNLGGGGTVSLVIISRVLVLLP